ncbi:cytochrome P450 CYP71D312-like [Rhododendron vialii]|uniref:cytochrome P450 CYP71D312-like n=1 Tax=Rhododendron vialii TaxID=182163 RepID=UPI0026603EF9|nr:cytochrome P450 CYP71D312-like [Rhododendron vialii]
MELQFSFSLIAFVVLLIFFLFYSVKLLKRSKRLPGPWKLPLIGSVHHFAIPHLSGTLPHHSLRNLARKYGALMHLQLGENSTIVVSSYQLAEEVLRTRDPAFANRQEVLAAKIMTYNYVDIVFSPYGKYWRQMRTSSTLGLLSRQKVHYFRSIRQDEVSRLIQSIKSSLDSPINLTKKIFSLTNDITFRAAFGKRCENKDALIPLIEEAIELSGGLDVSDLFPSLKVLHFLSRKRPKLQRLHLEMNEILENIIDEHEEYLESSEGGDGEAGEEDLVDELLGLKQRGDLQFPMTNNNIKAVILDIFFAGTETSSATVEWAMSEMVRNRRVMEKAQAELRQALKGKKSIDESHIQGLEYLKRVIKETLRLHPPVPLLLRECREQTEINGYLIPIKTEVIVNAWAIGRDPGYWKDAESFSPERFDNSSFDFTVNKHKYVPFGAGKRMCPGIFFGLANIELPLAQLLYHFDWKLRAGKPEDLDMTETFGAATRRRSNLHLIPTRYFS